ncbi:glycosyltransferase family 2 protein [Bacteroides caccae]|jgi:glycosyltransferase|uniref:glycosyltransferase family 2 protein n=1 Tax=Bacteroides caccae TaxID=47678 RepID=UPI00356A861E
MIKVSIIIATYNASKTLYVALNSVCNQTFSNWECIVVDGESKDNTVDIIKKFSDKDLRFRWLSEPDEGVYNAFNKGWKMAKGEWVYYLGADDEILPNTFDNIFGNKIDDWDVIYGNYLKSSQGKIEVVKSHSDPSFLRRNNTSHQAVIMRRKVIEDLKGFDERYKLCADYDILVRAYLKQYIFKYVDIDFAVFTIGGMSSKSLGTESWNIRRRNKTVNLFINTRVLLKRLLVHCLHNK